MSTKKIKIDENEINVAIIGEGKPLLILHGWGSSGKVMMSLAQNLSDYYTCIIPDLPGFGESPEPPRSYSVDDYADVAIQLIRELGFEKTDVLAHSFGGRMMLKLLSRPDDASLFDKVLITGGAGMKPRRSFGYYRRLYTAKILKSPFYLLPSSLREKGLDWLRNTAMWKSMGSGEYKELSGVMRESFVKTVTEHLESSLPAIKHEVLLLWGENDDATPLYQAERMDKGLQNSALVTIKNAGHYAFLDQPQQFVRISRAFFGADEKS